MKPNLVIFELFPEESYFISVPQDVISTEDLEKVHGKYGNTCDLTDEEDAILARVNEGEFVRIEGPVQCADFNMAFECGFIL